MTTNSITKSWMTYLNSTTFNSCLLNRWLNLSVAPPRCVLGSFIVFLDAFGCSAFLQRMPCPKSHTPKPTSEENGRAKRVTLKTRLPHAGRIRERSSTPRAVCNLARQTWALSLIYRLQERLLARRWHLKFSPFLWKPSDFLRHRSQSYLHPVSSNSSLWLLCLGAGRKDKRKYGGTFLVVQ